MKNYSQYLIVNNTEPHQNTFPSLREPVSQKKKRWLFHKFFICILLRGNDTSQD